MATMALLVDSNVLLDILTDDPAWYGASSRAVALAAGRGLVMVNDVIYAEISVRLPDVGACDAFLEGAGLRLEPIPREALFLAGRAHAAYRRRGGSRSGVLADFFIGAHALVQGWSVLTRDTARYRTAFPALRLMAP